MEAQCNDYKNFRATIFSKSKFSLILDEIEAMTCPLRLAID
jgi:hypothetical protein